MWYLNIKVCNSNTTKEKMTLNSVLSKWFTGVQNGACQPFACSLGKVISVYGHFLCSYIFPVIVIQITGCL